MFLSICLVVVILLFLRSESRRSIRKVISKLHGPAEADPRFRESITRYSFYFSKYSDVEFSEVEKVDVVNLWARPQTDIINVYIYGRGYHSGNGYLGSFHSNYLSEILHSGKYGVRGKILHIVQYEIFIEVEIVDFEKIQSDCFYETQALIRKRYKPRTSIPITFVLDRSFKRATSCTRLGCSPYELVLVSLADAKTDDILNDHVWLEDESGSKISIENRSSNKELIRVFRALGSGYDLFIEDAKELYTDSDFKLYQFSVRPKKQSSL